MRILFVGQTWRGSSARSMREALESIPDLLMDDVGEELFFPLYRSIFLRGLGRLTLPLKILEFERAIAAKLEFSKPDVLIVYKGNYVSSEFVKMVNARGVLTVNIFPDCSPHGFGESLQRAIGEYRLVISTKPFHPMSWSTVYGYNNQCVCVPHGYDPSVHYWACEPLPEKQDFDVVLAASWRQEYHDLMVGFAEEIRDAGIRVGLAGNGWLDRQGQFPANWEFFPPLYGRAYGEWLRRGKIAIAPVHSRAEINGVCQPGDQETTRTYELAAAHCFFLHRRTPFAQTIYDETREVPMWDDPRELAAQVMRFLPLAEERKAMALAAQRRAVPAYSIPTRAVGVLDQIRLALLRSQADPNCSE